MNVVLFEPHELVGDEMTFDGPRAAHVVQVLGASVGSTIRVGVVDGPLGVAEIVAIDGERVRARVTLEPEAPPSPRVDVVLALPRPKVLARLFSPLAQLGVRRVMLTGAYKVERAYFDTHVLTPETWRPLLLEGLAQARDTRLPVVTVHRSPTWLVREELPALVPEPALRLVADPAAPTSIRAAMAPAPERVVCAIGPEGGWAPREERLFDAHGFTRVGLGPRILRSDVAVVSTLTRIHDAFVS